jgi:hypothetical protein
MIDVDELRIRIENYARACEREAYKHGMADICCCEERYLMLPNEEKSLHAEKMEEWGFVMNMIEELR